MNGYRAVAVWLCLLASLYISLRETSLLVVSGEPALPWAKIRVCPVQRSLWKDGLSKGGYIFFLYLDPRGSRVGKRKILYLIIPSNFCALRVLKEAGLFSISKQFQGVSFSFSQQGGLLRSRLSNPIASPKGCVEQPSVPTSVILEGRTSPWGACWGPQKTEPQIRGRCPASPMTFSMTLCLTFLGRILNTKIPLSCYFRDL